MGDRKLICIPEKLFIILKENTKTVILKPEEKPVEVIPVFIVPADSDRFIKTAKKWQTGSSFIIENEPISNLRIVGLDKRIGGGRAYKVIYPPNYLVDLREDVLLDIIYNCGIDIGGKINGDFVWFLNHSQMKLIRTNSQLYNSFKSNYHGLSIILNKDLKVGSIYCSKTGSPQLFLGFISTLFFTPHWVINRLDRTGTIYRSSLKQKKLLLWFSIKELKKASSLIGKFNKFISWDTSERFSHRIILSSNHSMVKELDSINLSDDIIYFTRDILRNEIRNSIIESHSSSVTLITHFKKLNMVPYGRNIFENMMPECVELLV